LSVVGCSGCVVAMKLFGRRKDSVPTDPNQRDEDQSRYAPASAGFSAQDLLAWRKHDDEGVFGRKSSKTSPTPVGLVGIVGQDSMDLLFATDKDRRKRHAELKGQFFFFFFSFFFFFLTTRLRSSGD
jgi:hypothetical protein